MDRVTVVPSAFSTVERRVAYWVKKMADMMVEYWVAELVALMEI